MLKCLECGFESERLQWSHFKYKCTGRFKNGREYQQAYPSAKLVDDNLAKKSAITLKNLIQKYGQIEGQIKWDNYRKKQAYTNSYEYKKEKYGWSKDQFDQYNSSRAQTLEKMISRYGETEGAQRWQTYCERQSYTNTKEYFIKKYGLEKGYQKYLDINKSKSVSNPKILSEKLGVTLQEATDIIVSRQKNFFSSNLEKEFIKSIEDKIGKLENSSINKPFGKWSEYLDTYVVYDIKHKNCIIEFNGDYWHGNPKIYKDDAVIRGTLVKNIQARDYLKLKTVEDLGFRTLVIWESDYKQNKQKTIQGVIQWILKEQK